MVLEQIIASVKQELEARHRVMPLAELSRMAAAQPPALDLADALRGDRVRLITEVKRASPSRGVIRTDFDPAAIAKIYADNGAAAISVLTETSHFQGRLDYLLKIRQAIGNRKLPLLRKDFIFEPYQVYESRAYGADGLLLIVAVLDIETLGELLELSRELGMACLVEVHNETELNTALKSPARIIGINNRDLHTFTTDLSTTAHLRPLIPEGRIVVSESGIKGRADIDKLKQWGVDAALVGEALMAAPDIATKMKELA